MGLFDKILNKLGVGEEKEPQKPAQPADISAASVDSAQATVADASDATAVAEAAVVEKSVAITQVDMVAQLEAMAASSSQPLNWKTSIVDLLKLLDLDSSYSARKELAAELECPADKMGDSAQMNIWLHKTVLQRLADNGGNIPSDLL